MGALVREHARVTLSYGLLLLATVATIVLVEATELSRAVAVVLVVLAGLKVALVLWEFMELRAAPTSWRIALGVWWVAATTAVLVGALIS